MQYLIGIHIGTCGTKSVLFDTTGRVITVVPQNIPFISRKTAG